MLSELPSNWQNFLRDLDNSLEQETKLNCIGGFVIRALYNFHRETSDLDFILKCFGHFQCAFYKFPGESTIRKKVLPVAAIYVLVSLSPVSKSE